MKKVLNSTTQAGLKDTNEPRLFRDLHPNTELCVDLKFLTCKPGRLPIGGMIVGIIIRDDEDHFTFTEAKAEQIVQYVNEKK